MASPIRIFGNNGQIAGLADVWVERFGAKGDNSTDCIGPLNRAHTCIANPGYISGTFSGRTTLRFGRGGCRVSSTWVVMPRVDFSLRILGCGSNLDGTRIVAMPSANITMMRVDGPVGMTANMDFEMRDMGFEVTDQNLAAPRCVCLQFNVSGDGRYILGGKESIIDNCYFFGQYCVIGWRLIKMLFSRCHFHTPNSAGQSFGVQLHGQKGTGSDWAGCDTVRFQYCHWQGTWNNPTMIGLYIQAENSVTAIQFDTCEWFGTHQLCRAANGYWRHIGRCVVQALSV